MSCFPRSGEICAALRSCPSVSLPSVPMKESLFYSDPMLAGSRVATAQANAMEAAASNTAAGPAMAFMGMGMAGQAGGMNAANLFQMGQQQYAQPAPAPAPAPAATGWTCACGTVATGNFCPECGTPKPADGWTCACGSVNKGKFCPECGARKPAGIPQYKCDKCGWEPEKGVKPPKFCPECGDPFDDGDIV